MMVDARRVSRRTAISAAVGGLAVAGLGASSRRTPSEAAAAMRAGLRQVSMAMHIHGPFSEGIASYDAHLHEAQRTGVDVIWWTDHDFRVAAHAHRRAVDFDGPAEPEGELLWTWAARPEGDLTATGLTFEAQEGRPGTALAMSATGGGPSGGILWYAGTAWNYSYSTCIADTTLELDVRPDTPGAVLLLQVELSHHPARGGLPAGQYVLRYRFGDVPRRHTAEGLLGTVDVPARVGRWRRHRLDLVEDVARLWPNLVAEDNSLRNLRVGLAAPARVTAHGAVDRLRFDRARRRGQAGDELRRKVLSRYQREYAGVTHHRAYEVSMTRHLNWYGGDRTLPEFPSPPLRDNDAGLAESVVRWLHQRGGVVCWNHPMDVETRESLATLMIARNNLGADLVEIGRKPLPDLLWVFDVAARNAIFFTAVGATDDHAGQDWLAREERWVTHAWARSTGRGDLVDSLRKGRAWFADPLGFQGTLDLGVDGRTAMGAVLLTREPAVSVDIHATDLPPNATLEVVTGVTDRAGIGDLEPAVEIRALHPALFARGPYALAVPPGSGSYVRTQVRASDGAVIAVSNPLWLLRDAPPHGVPAARALA